MREQPKEISRLITFIKRRRRVTRHQIIRRYAISRARCDQLLQSAMGVDGFGEHIQIRKTSFGKAEWIIYTD